MTATFSTGSKINFSVWACHISGAFLVLFWCSRGRIWLKFGWLQHSPQIYSKINFRVRACHISGVGHWILQVHLHCFSTSCWIIKDCILECKCCKKQTAADVLSISLLQRKFAYLLRHLLCYCKGLTLEMSAVICLSWHLLYIPVLKEALSVLMLCAPVFILFYIVHPEAQLF